jgi:hypothetical protein
VSRDLALDGGPGTRSQPGEEDAGHGTSIRRGHPNDEDVLLRVPDPFDGRASDPGPCRFDAQTMEIAPESDLGTIVETAPRIELGLLACLLGEVPAQPVLALGEEGLDPWFRPRPGPTAGRRHGHHHTSVGVDDDAQAA